MLKRLIVENKYDIVHTHTPVASACVRIACRKMKNVYVVYTAHGFHFYNGAPLKNWLFYYPIEKWLSKYTDLLITINNEDYNRGRTFSAKKVVNIPGVGIETKNFANLNISKEAMRNNLGISDNQILLLSVGEISKRKNHEIIIRAISKLDKPNIVYCICGQGFLEKYLLELAKKYNVNLKLLGFRNDVAQIYQAADVFVFPSLHEGLPVALMEAMTVGLPIVCSNIRGNTDIINNGQGGFLVESNDPIGFANAINNIIDDTSLRKRMSEYNRETIKKYELENVLKELKKLYLEV
jgi:glycosyltransferase involved in cell wall biosynthesis